MTFDFFLTFKSLYLLLIIPEANNTMNKLWKAFKMFNHTYENIETLPITIFPQFGIFPNSIDEMHQDIRVANSNK